MARGTGRPPGKLRARPGGGTDSHHDALGGDITTTVAHPHRFGPSSTYSLAPAELAAHVHQLRRHGWQCWELRVRFGIRRCA